MSSAAPAPPPPPSSPGPPTFGLDAAAAGDDAATATATATAPPLLEQGPPPPNAFKIAGVQVPFPAGRRPFPQQFSLMCHVVAALTRSENALVESPTGTGKTLALLSSTLAWQHAELQRACAAYVATPPPPTVPAAVLKACAPDVAEAILEEARVQAERSRPLPPAPVKIFYASRTHSQLAQVMNELKRCPDALLHPTHPITFTRMATEAIVLGSRDHLCIHPDVNKFSGSDKTDKCIETVERGKCGAFKRAKSMVGPVRNQIMDVEDLVSHGRGMRTTLGLGVGCPFYAVREALEHARIVFVPFNYLLAPSIRKSVKLDKHLQGAVVVFDEAHNVEDTCRDAASCERDVESLLGCGRALLAAAARAGKAGASCTVVGGFLMDLARWCSEFPANENNPDDARPVLRGPDAIASWAAQGIAINENTVKTLVEQVQAISARDREKMAEAAKRKARNGGALDFGTPPEPPDEDDDEEAFMFETFRDIQPEDEERAATTSSSSSSGGGGGGGGGGGDRKILSAGMASLLDNLLTTLRFMTSENNRFAKDYRVVVRVRTVYQRNRRPEKQRVMCLWCLSPAVAMRDLASVVRSIVLTSGTLNPLDALEAELGVPFPHRLEASHVADLSRQLFACAVPCGPDGIELDARFGNADKDRYVMALGETIVGMVKSIPNGVLCFFASYGALERAVELWKKGTTWHRLEEAKQIYMEPKQTGDAFNVTISDYRRDAATERGAMFFGVFRGKLSEGIDFADEMARGVIVTSVPYPNVRDLLVLLKKEHQDDRAKAARGGVRSSSSSSGATATTATTGTIPVLSGDEWLNQTAYRALNQAIGRCIRHRNDYGVVALLESRFVSSNTIKNLSGWFRPAVKAFGAREAVAGCGEFFRKMKESPPSSWGPVAVAVHPTPALALSSSSSSSALESAVTAAGPPFAAATATATAAAAATTTTTTTMDLTTEPDDPLFSDRPLFVFAPTPLTSPLSSTCRHPNNAPLVDFFHRLAREKVCNTTKVWSDLAIKMTELSFDVTDAVQLRSGPLKVVGFGPRAFELMDAFLKAGKRVTPVVEAVMNKSSGSGSDSSASEPGAAVASSTTTTAATTATGPASKKKKPRLAVAPPPHPPPTERQVYSYATASGGTENSRLASQLAKSVSSSSAAVAVAASKNKARSVKARLMDDVPEEQQVFNVDDDDDLL